MSSQFVRKVFGYAGFACLVILVAAAAAAMVFENPASPPTTPFVVAGTLFVVAFMLASAVSYWCMVAGERSSLVPSILGAVAFVVGFIFLLLQDVVYGAGPAPAGSNVFEEAGNASLVLMFALLLADIVVLWLNNRRLRASAS